MKPRLIPSKIKRFTKKEEIEFKEYCTRKMKILLSKIRCCKCKEWKPLVSITINEKESFMCRDCIMAIPITKKENKDIKEVEEDVDNLVESANKLIKDIR